jgi:hypothetical protein
MLYFHQRQQSSSRLTAKESEMIGSPEILHRNKAPRKAGTGALKIMHIPLLGGWYIVRGKYHTPLGGRFETRADAVSHLAAKRNK